MLKKPSRLTRKNRRIVGSGVLGERLSDEDAGIVDERIYATKPGHAFGDRSLGRLPIGDVAGNHQEVGIARRFNRARCSYHPIVTVAICLYERCANALRGAGNDSKLSVRCP
jgi:hypothetical protein